MPGTIRYKNPDDIAKALKQNIRTFTARFSEDTKNKLYENTKMYWYEAYRPIIYQRMGEDGGVLGAIKRTPIYSQGKGNWQSIVYFDINEIIMDVVTYTNSAGRTLTYGRHTNHYGTTDLRSNVIDWMENRGVRGHEEPGEMIQKTAEWVEEQLSTATRVESYLDTTLTGMKLQLIRTK